MSRPADLPNYTKPPVTEVFLSVQFDAIQGFRHIDVGPLYERFRDRFPEYQEQAPLAPAFETFGPNAPNMIFSTGFFAGSIPLPRFWFVSAGKAELLQFQTDRFSHNWRKIAADHEYPRYEPIKDSFFRELQTLSSFLADRDLPPLVFNQIEIGYINHVLIDEPEHPDPTGKIFRFWTDTDMPVLGIQDDARFLARFVLRNEVGEPIGRLHAEANKARSPDGRQAIQFTLTARGRPGAPTLDALSEFLDLGREKIVRGFTELTRPEMHELWGRLS